MTLKILSGIGAVLVMVAVGCAGAKVLMLWIEWATALKSELWSIALSPIGPLAVVVLVAVFMFGYTSRGTPESESK